MGREGETGSDRAEHVIVCAHRVVVHEQVASEGFVVEVAGEVAHLAFEIVAFVDDVPGEVFFAVPLAAVGFLEVVEFVVELQVVVYGFLTVLVAHIRVFEDIVEVVLRHEALVVPLPGESLVVLCHQLRVFLVGVDRLAEVDKIVVGVNIVSRWLRLSPAKPKETNPVLKFKRYAARTTFPSAFICKCLAAVPSKGCYENRLTTGTCIDGEIISLEAIRKYAPWAVNEFRKALSERRNYTFDRFDFRGYDGSLWLIVVDKDDN